MRVGPVISGNNTCYSADNTITATATTGTVTVSNDYITNGYVTNTVTTGTSPSYTYSPISEGPTVTTKTIQVSANTHSDPDFFTIHDPAEIKKVEEIVPYMVYRFTFHDNTRIKTVCAEEDTFNLDYAFYLAIAKKLWGKSLTFEGVLKKADDISYDKYYIKIVKKAKKQFKEDLEKKKKEEEEKELKKQRRKKNAEKKQVKKEKKKQAEQDFLIEAIRKALERGV